MNDSGPFDRPSAASDDRHRRHHERKCSVCSHPDRDLIEEAFVNWGSPHAISCHYQLPSGSLRRHAKAFGLDLRRQGNLRAALDNILERSVGAKVTGETVIRAVRAYTCLTDDNRWIEPPTSSSPPSTSLSPLLRSSQPIHLCRLVLPCSARLPKILIAPLRIRK